MNIKLLSFPRSRESSRSTSRLSGGLYIIGYQAKPGMTDVNITL